jgi:hypothetical protein
MSANKGFVFEALTVDLIRNGSIAYVLKPGAIVQRVKVVGFRIYANERDNHPYIEYEIKDSAGATELVSATHIYNNPSTAFGV